MIAPSHLRALLGAALCCAPVLDRAADGLPGGATSWTGNVPCADSWQDRAALLLASASPANVNAAAPAPSAPGNGLESPSPTGPGKITGDISTSSDQFTTDANGQSELSGNVSVHMGQREIEADKLIYDRNTNSLSASGQVRYRDPIVRMQGETGHYGDDGARFNRAQFEFLKQPGYGSAEQISMTPDNVVTLHKVTYTSCPAPRADWQIRARELRLDTGAGRGIGRGATVDFEGIPIAYLPWISFPLSTARQSGLLFPNFGSSTRSGIFLGVPWYWNIAPNQDATVTPTLYSLRGLDLGVEYRFLSASNSGSIDGDYLNYDRVYHGERSYVRLLDRHELGWNTRIDTSAVNVSDTQYFEDFTQGSQSTSTAFVARSIAIGHRDDVWNLRAQLLGFQTLDDTLAVDARPYIQLPRLTAAALWSARDWPLLQTGFDSELVNFTRSTCFTSATCVDAANGAPTAAAAAVSGWRLDAKPQIGLDLSGPGYFMRPSLAWELTQYSLRDAGSADSSPKRSLPILSLDTGLEFERLAGSHGVRNVTLEPRLMYVYIPYRDQSPLPIFDATTPDPNPIELFRPNRYVGVDRIGDANAVTLGVTTQMFESASGMRYLSATIGQSIYLQPPRVTMPGDNLDSRNTSSLIGEINLTAYRNWNLLVDVASDAAVSRVEQAVVALQYLASNKQVANVGYRFRSGELEQIDGSTAWPIGGHWDAYARAVYSLRDGESIEDFAGFQYRGACWSVRAVAQRSVSTRTGAHDTGVSLQLELTGLSGVGTGVSTFLEQSIRGYSASVSKPASSSPTL